MRWVHGEISRRLRPRDQPCPEPLGVAEGRRGGERRREGRPLQRPRRGAAAAERQMHDSVFVPHGGLSSASRLVAPFTSDGTRVPAFVIHFGILVNTDLVKPSDEPRSWNDLLLPRWKGQILADDVHPVGSGSLFFPATYGKLGRGVPENLAAP